MKKVKLNQKTKRNLKVFSFISIFVIAVYAFALQVFAADGRFVLESDATTYAKGDEVAVDITIQTDKDWSSGAITLTYDTDVFDGDEVAFEKGLKNADGANLARSTANKFTVQDIGEAGKISIAVAYIDSSNDEATYSGTLTLGTLYLPVKTDAKGGKTTITVVKESTGDEVTTFLADPSKELSIEADNLDVSIEVPLESHSVDKTSIALDVTDKKTDTITVNYSPADTSAEKGFSFVSADESIATVSANDGVATVTAVAPGETTITVTEFGATHTIPVTVTANLKSISLNKTELELGKDDSETLTVTYNPTNTTQKGVTWSSSNGDAVTVDANGKVTAVGGGTATITATSTANGSIVDTCEVTVVVPFTSVTLEQDSFNLNKNATATLKVNYAPADATQSKTVTWTSNDESVATVSSTGVITAVGAGTTTIKGTVGKFNLTATVNVKVPMESFTAKKTSIELMPSQKQQIETVITPEDTTDNKTITWSSANTGVATVDNGLITAVAEGTTTVTGTLENGKKVTITVKVLKAIEGISLSQTEATLYKGDSSRNKVKLTEIITPADADEDKTVTWTSSNDSVAKVDQAGNVTAVGGGTATITAALKNGMSASCTVKVEVAITEFKLTSESSVTIDKGATSQVKYQINPSDATEDKTITWKSNNTSVATVNNGVITGAGKGSTTVTGTLPNGMTITVSVEVVVPVTSVTINGDATRTMNRGDSTTLTAVVNPSDANDKTVTWKSDKTSVVTVNSNGEVTAVGTGSAKVTATAGTKSATVTINVVAPITAFTATPTELEVIKGKTGNINTEITPTDTTDNKTITWTSEDTSIATVDANGLVTGVKAGTTKVTGTLENGMKVEVNVTVKIIPVASVSLNKTSLEVKKGSSETLKATVNPEDTTEDKTVTWTTSDETVATVDENGKVTGVKAGTVTITAKAGDNKIATAEVTVKEIPLEEIAISNTEDKVEVDKSLQLKVVENPDNPEGTTEEVTYTYESSDESIAIVDANGKVKGISKGLVTITVRSSNGLVDTIQLHIVEPEVTASPNTGVPSVFIYILSAFISLSGIGFVILKKRFN